MAIHFELIACLQDPCLDKIRFEVNPSLPAARAATVLLSNLGEAKRWSIVNHPLQDSHHASQDWIW